MIKKTNYVVTKKNSSLVSKVALYLNSSFHSLSQLEIVSEGFRLDPSDDRNYYS